MGFLSLQFAVSLKVISAVRHIMFVSDRGGKRREATKCRKRKNNKQVSGAFTGIFFFALHCVTFTSIIQSGSILMCSVQKDCVLFPLT